MFTIISNTIIRDMVVTRLSKKSEIIFLEKILQESHTVVLYLVNCLWPSPAIAYYVVDIAVFGEPTTSSPQIL